MRRIIAIAVAAVTVGFGAFAPPAGAWTIQCTNATDIVCEVVEEVCGRNCECDDNAGVNKCHINLLCVYYEDVQPEPIACIPVP